MGLKICLLILIDLAPQIMEKLRPNESRSRHVLALLWIILMLEMILLVSNYLQYDLLNTVINDGDYTFEELEANDLRVGLLGIIYLIAFLTSGFLFIRWFRRAYFNLHVKVKFLNQSEGWAAGAWFVPFINLFRPYQIMKELFIETRLYVKRFFGKELDLSSSWVLSWWVLWLISGVLGRISLGFLKKENTVENLLDSTMIDMTINLLGIPLALITIYVVRKYAIAEQIMYDLCVEEEKIQSSLKSDLL